MNDEYTHLDFEVSDPEPTGAVMAWTDIQDYPDTAPTLVMGGRKAPLAALVAVLGAAVVVGLSALGGTIVTSSMTAPPVVTVTATTTPPPPPVTTTPPPPPVTSTAAPEGPSRASMRQAFCAESNRRYAQNTEWSFGVDEAVTWVRQQFGVSQIEATDVIDSVGTPHFSGMNGDWEISCR
jgi:hypothetical protein